MVKTSNVECFFLESVISSLTNASQPLPNSRAMISKTTKRI